jgi:tetratricopeptide (TPR) repeat protein
MPPRRALSPLFGTYFAFAAMVLACRVSPLAAQVLPLARDYPGDGPFECPSFPAPAAPDEDERARGAQLESEARQATIIGDLQRAEELLTRAVEVDPASGDLAYQHARALESLNRPEEAILEFCRALSLGTEEDARERLDSLYEMVRERIPARARRAFAAGLDQADAEFYEGALESFTVAIESAPDWPPPIYNRGVIYERLGRVGESLADYRRYLELVPSQVDAQVMDVSQRIGLLEGSATAPSPAGAFVLGFLPGMGHYYSGNPIRGTVFLALAGSATVAGVLVKNVTVVCVNDVGPGQDCPAPLVHDEITERPLLMPAVGVAAAITLIGAIDALLKARGRRAEVERLASPGSEGGVRLRAPSVSSASGRLDVNLLRVTFR